MGSLGRGVRGLASVLLAAGVIGSVGSGIVLLIVLLAAPGRAHLAGHVFIISGQVLCAGVVLFGAGRLLDRPLPPPIHDDHDEEEVATSERSA
jgi:hypothetical protein